ncbi:MAG TPA: secretin N-terminal domain-containing protein, partial [Planctomycetaceae bacterium]|nr:secretin N-terminal domain-containing protein [Planctomycetaceae bacterium]
PHSAIPRDGAAADGAPSPADPDAVPAALAELENHARNDSLPARRAGPWLRLVRSDSRDGLPPIPARDSSDEQNRPPAAPEKSSAVQSTDNRPAPVHIDRDAEGRLVIASRDSAALDLLKEVVGEIGLAPREFKVFRMKHKSSWAYSIAENLKQFFDEKRKGEKQKDERAMARFYDPNGGKWINASREGERRKLQSQRQPKFIVDMDSNSILVVGADRDQLKTVEELIDVYDTAEAKDPQPTRVTRLVKIRHSQARQIADAIKDVYRDLLSSTEQPQRSDQRYQRPLEPLYTFAYGAVSKGLDLPQTLVKFKGQLSIGVDEFSNTLVVSAPSALLESVIDTIEELDEASRAAGQRIQVLKIDRTVNANELQKRLQKVMTKPPSPHQSGQGQQSAHRQ